MMITVTENQELRRNCFMLSDWQKATSLMRISVVRMEHQRTPAFKGGADGYQTMQETEENMKGALL